MFWLFTHIDLYTHQRLGERGFKVNNFRRYIKIEFLSIFVILIFASAAYERIFGQNMQEG